MNKYDEKFYEVRIPDPFHNYSIASFKRTTQAQYEALIRRVFLHQPATYEDHSDSDGRTGVTFSDHELADYFYRECYLRPPMTIGKGQEIAIETFIDDALLCEHDPRRNHLSFLIGEVGSGKTAFINYLITRYGKTWVEQKNFWFVRFDLEINGQNKLLSPNEFIHRLAKTVVTICTERPEILAGKSDIKQVLIELKTALGPPEYNGLADKDKTTAYYVVQQALKKLT